MTFEFACRGDLAPVAGYVDGTSQAWVRAYRLLDDARESLGAAETRFGEDEYDATLDAVDDADADLETARARLAEVGVAAAATFEEDAAHAIERARTLPRTIHDARAGTAHADGRARWRDGEYEQAHDRFETAIDAYRTAERAPGSEPTDAELADRRERAESELAELRRIPLARAQQIANGAASIDGPAPAAAKWEDALRRYQDVLWLDWGREERRFDGDPERIKEAIVDAVDHLVTERRAAARACREAARDHQMAGAPGAARAAYRTALDHLEHAASIVDEVAPNRETGLDDTVAAVEDELAAVGESADGGTAAGELGRAALPGPATERLGELVAEYWTDHGWTVEREDGDFVATCDEPVELRAYVRVHGQSTPADADGVAIDDGVSEPEAAADAIDRPAEASERRTDAIASAIEECAAGAGFVDAGIAVLATVGEPSAEAEKRATDDGVHLQDVSAVVDGSDDFAAGPGAS